MVTATDLGGPGLATSTTDEPIEAPAGQVARWHFLVLRDEPERFGPGGIEIPNPDIKKTGTVVKVGLDVPPPLRAGFRLAWCFENSMELTLDGVSYLVMSETEDSVEYAFILPDTRKVIPHDI